MLLWVRIPVLTSLVKFFLMHKALTVIRHGMMHVGQHIRGIGRW